MCHKLQCPHLEQAGTEVIHLKQANRYLQHKVSWRHTKLREARHKSLRSKQCLFRVQKRYKSLKDSLKRAVQASHLQDKQLKAYKSAVKGLREQNQHLELKEAASQHLKATLQGLCAEKQQDLDLQSFTNKEALSKQQRVFDDKEKRWEQQRLSFLSTISNQQKQEQKAHQDRELLIQGLKNNLGKEKAFSEKLQLKSNQDKKTIDSLRKALDLSIKEVDQISSGKAISAKPLAQGGPIPKKASSLIRRDRAYKARADLQAQENWKKNTQKEVHSLHHKIKALQKASPKATPSTSTPRPPSATPSQLEEQVRVLEKEFGIKEGPKKKGLKHQKHFLLKKVRKNPNHPYKDPRVVGWSKEESS